MEVVSKMEKIAVLIVMSIIMLSVVYAQTTCQDSDNGKEYYTKGTCYDSGNYAQGGTDNCYVENGVTYLSELYCDSTNLKCVLETNYKCPYGCQDGACAKEAVEKVVCSDSDGGKEYNKKGIVKWWVSDFNEYRTSEDTCRETEEGNNLYSGPLLVENVCEGDVLGASYYKCPNGCKDGACVTTEPAQGCSDSDGGENIYISGSTISYIEGVGKGTVDNCEFLTNPNGQLNEAVCKDGKPDFVSITCPLDAPYCRDGRCTKENTAICKDTDNGDYPAILGTMTEARYGDNLVQHTDYCEDLKTLQPVEKCDGEICGLREYYCTEPYVYTTYRDVKCSTCVNGICEEAIKTCMFISMPAPEEGCKYIPKYDANGCVTAYDKECKGQSFCGNGICEAGENELVCEATIMSVKKIGMTETTVEPATATINKCVVEAKLKFGEPIIEAYNFNGISTYVSMGDNTLSTLDVTKGTISAWVKLGDPGTAQDTIIDFEGWLAMTVKPGGVLACCSDGICHAAMSTVRVDDNEWHHVACTWDGAAFTKVYVDGELAGSTKPVQSPQLDRTQRNQRIGARSLNLDYFKGAIAKPTIWNSVFSDEEIKKLYLAGAPKDNNVLDIPCESTTEPNTPTKCKFKCPQDCGVKPVEPPVIVPQPPIAEENCEKKTVKCVEEFMAAAQKDGIDFTTVTNKDELYSVCKRFACIEFQKEEEKKCNKEVMECAKKKTANAGGNSFKNMITILEAIRICDKEIGCSYGLVPTPQPLPVEKCPTGCFYATTYKCVPFGTRISKADLETKKPAYCDLTGEFTLQKENGDQCQNNWECKSNECGEGECRSTYGLLQKIFKWLTKLFGRGAVEKAAVSEAAQEEAWALSTAS